MHAANAPKPSFGNNSISSGSPSPAANLAMSGRHRLHATSRGALGAQRTLKTQGSPRPHAGPGVVSLDALRTPSPGADRRTPRSGGQLSARQQARQASRKKNIQAL